MYTDTHAFTPAHARDATFYVIKMAKEKSWEKKSPGSRRPREWVCVGVWLTLPHLSMSHPSDGSCCSCTGMMGADLQGLRGKGLAELNLSWLYALPIASKCSPRPPWPQRPLPLPRLP